MKISLNSLNVEFMDTDNINCRVEFTVPFRIIEKIL